MTSVSAAVYALPVVPRVNLMPRAETERREKSALLRRWVGGVLAALAVVAAVSAGAYWLQFGAAQRLAAENARTDSLLSQLASFSDIRATLDLQSELTELRSQAMATDQSWTSLISSVEGVLPSGVAVSGFLVAPAGAPTGDDPAAEIGAAGSIFVVSDTPQEIVPLVRAVRPLPGVLVAEAWAVSLTEKEYTYEIRFALDQSVYTGAYNEEEGE